jgi:hypothetical protein
MGRPVYADHGISGTLESVHACTGARLGQLRPEPPVVTDGPNRPVQCVARGPAVRE